MFYDDPDVLTISIHQDNVFPPNSGALDERGEGAGARRPRSTSRSHRAPATAATCTPSTRSIVPAVRAFRPDLVLVASGFDAGIMDPLARQMVTSRGFAAIAGRILDVAAECCDGRGGDVARGRLQPDLRAVLRARRARGDGRRAHVLDDPFFPWSSACPATS